MDNIDIDKIDSIIKEVAIELNQAIFFINAIDTRYSLNSSQRNGLMQWHGNVTKLQERLDSITFGGLKQGDEQTSINGSALQKMRQFRKILLTKINEVFNTIETLLHN